MWADEAVPRLQAIGLGAPVASRTYRLAGIGESQVAELLGEAMLRATNPIVATYARVDAVDVRISAVAVEATSAEELVESAAGIVEAKLGDYVWATGETTWSDAIGARFAELGWTLAVVEIGTAGSIAALLGDAPWLRFDESIAPDAPAATAHGTEHTSERGLTHGAPDVADEAAAEDLIRYARRARELGGADVGLAVRTRPRSGDMAVSIAVVAPSGERQVRRLVFLTGGMGRSRAALAAATVLLEVLGETPA
jgi:nicotinamide-nucleotide amidase